MAWLTTPALIGPVLGPPLGGFITTYFSWRWIFDINIPIGIARHHPGHRCLSMMCARPRGQIRLASASPLSGTALSCVMFGLETAGRGVVPASDFAGRARHRACWPGWATAVHAPRHPAPLIDFTLLRYPHLPGGGHRRHAVPHRRRGHPVPAADDAAAAFGRSPLQSGIITFASSAGALVMKPVVDAALRLLGFRDTLMINGALRPCCSGCAPRSGRPGRWRRSM